MYLGDLDRARSDSQGIISYATSLSRAVGAQLSDDDRMVVVCCDAIADELRDLGLSEPVELVVWPATRSRLRRLLRDTVGVALAARRAGATTVHLPKGLLLNRRILGVQCLVTTVHDDIPVRYLRGEFVGPASRAKLKTVVGAIHRSLRDSDVVVTDSLFSRTALATLRPEGPNPEIIVAGCASTLGEHEGPRARQDSIVIFDSPFEHKHAIEALEFALRYISRAGTHTTVTLLGCGAAAESPLALDRRVRRIARSLAPDELREILIRANAVVVSSRYEGFGLPPVETWSLGTPAVVAACGAAKEVLAGLPGLYEPGDFESFVESLTTVLALSQAEVDGYGQFIRLRHSWMKTGQAVIAAYRGLPSSPRRSQ